MPRAFGQQEREKLINQAQSEYNQVVPRAAGEAQQTVQQAEGYALDRVNRAQGDAARFRAYYAAYQQAPEVTRRRIYLETMGQILPKVQRKVVVDTDVRGILPLLNRHWSHLDGHVRSRIQAMCGRYSIPLAPEPDLDASS